MRRVGMVVAATAVAASSLLVGCGSQLDALAPVGGDAVTGVTFAATDVLLQRKLGILEAPVCTLAGTAVACVGSLTDGTRVSVTADVTSKPHTMTVTAGGEVLYDGDVQSVLDDAARAGNGVSTEVGG